MKPLMLEGGAALSRFRLDALTHVLAAQNPVLGGVSIETTFIYLLDVAHTLSTEADGRVRSLLNARDAAEHADGFYVTPRKGTISPWSSKATDIFHNCGLADVRRVERGIHFRIRDAAGQVVAAEALGKARELLHDRMTEGLYAELGDFFAHRPPAPGRVFDALKQGLAAIEEANRTMGLALSADEMSYLCDAYQKAKRNPTDTELVMWTQNRLKIY